MHGIFFMVNISSTWNICDVLPFIFRNEYVISEFTASSTSVAETLWEDFPEYSLYREADLKLVCCHLYPELLRRSVEYQV